MYQQVAPVEIYIKETKTNKQTNKQTENSHNQLSYLNSNTVVIETVRKSVENMSGFWRAYLHYSTCTFKQASGRVRPRGLKNITG